MTTYRVPFENGESAFTEKRSRFISHIWRVETEEAPADAFFQYNTRRKGMPEVRVEKNCASSTKNVGYFW